MCPWDVRGVDLGVPKLANGLVVDFGDAPALDALVRLQTVVLVAFVVQILLEVIVDGFAVGLGEATLGFVVAVPEVVALAAGQEVEA